MTTSPDIRVYINERGVSVAPGSTALDAVRVLFPAHAEEIAAGTMQLTDSRGLPVGHGVAASGGAIFRVVPVRNAVESGN